MPSQEQRQSDLASVGLRGTIRKYLPDIIFGANDGIITTLAGTGVPGISGDGGQAVAAQLDTPTGIAVHPDGNILFVDAQNQRIRRIDAQGVITTIVGNGELGFSGDGGPATNASINTPEQMWVDPEGNIYVADTYNRRVGHVGRAREDLRRSSLPEREPCTSPTPRTTA